MTSIEKIQREEYLELLVCYETAHASRNRMASHIVALEAALRQSRGGQAMVTQLRKEAGYDQLELAVLDDHCRREGDSAA